MHAHRGLGKMLSGYESSESSDAESGSGNTIVKIWTKLKNCGTVVVHSSEKMCEALGLHKTPGALRNFITESLGAMTSSKVYLQQHGDYSFQATVKGMGSASFSWGADCTKVLFFLSLSLSLALFRFLSVSR
jgi:hypothetical protein